MIISFFMTAFINLKDQGEYLMVLTIPAEINETLPPSFPSTACKHICNMPHVITARAL